MTTYRKESFEQFLGRMHTEEEPTILDDELPDAFDHWLGTLGIDLMMAYAEKWHLEQILANLND
jgi:hypothetical protein